MLAILVEDNLSREDRTPVVVVVVNPSLRRTAHLSTTNNMQECPIIYSNPKVGHLLSVADVPLINGVKNRLFSLSHSGFEVVNLCKGHIVLSLTGSWPGSQVTDLASAIGQIRLDIETKLS